MTQIPPKASVFISYSRKDKAFVQELHQALTKGQREVWVDWKGIAPTEDWRQAIAQGIETYDHFIYVISPDSIVSIECNKEIDHALSHNKRLIPILYREVDDQKVRHEISKHNYIFFRDSDNFQEALNQLKKALDTDLIYAKKHTELLYKATTWKQKNYDTSYLLRGTALREAQQWITQSINQTPNPTQLQNDYIITSTEQSRKLLFKTALGIGGLALVALASLLIALIERNMARQAEILALTGWATARLSKNEQIEALIDSLQAAEKLNHAFVLNQQKKTELTEYVETTLREIVYTIKAQNHFQNNTKEIHDVKFAPNNQWIASASDDHTVTIWQSGKSSKSLPHNNSVWRVSIAPNSQMIASASEDKTIKIWQQKEDENWILERTLFHSVPVKAVTFTNTALCPNQKPMIASGGADGVIRLWTLEGQLQTSFKAHNQRINDLKISPDCQTLASASDDQTAKLWDLTGKEKAVLQGHEDVVWEVNFSPNGKKIATASFDTMVKLWKGNSQGKSSAIATLQGHANWVKSVIFSPNNHQILSGSNDAIVKIWSQEGRLIQDLKNPHGDVNSMSFAPNNQRLVIAGSQGKIGLWNLSGRWVEILRGHTSGVTAVRFAPHEKLLASVSTDQTVRLWHINASGKRTELKKTIEYRQRETQGGLSNVNFVTPDGQLIVTASYDNTIQLWDIQKIFASPQPEPEYIFRGHKDQVNNLSVSLNGQILASASEDGTIKLWDLKTRQLLRTLEKAHQNQVTDITFLPDQKHLISVGSDGYIKVWNIQGQLIQSFQGHDDWINSLMFSPQKQLLATAGRDNIIHLWQWKNNQLIEQPYQTFAGHNDWVWDVAFSPNGERLASAGKDDTIKIWNVSYSTKNSLIVTLKGHQDWVRSVSFSPCNQTSVQDLDCDTTLYLASGSSDKNIILWNFKEILKIETEENGETALESLSRKGCEWLSEYLKTNPDTSESDQLRFACRDIKLQQD